MDLIGLSMDCHSIIVFLFCVTAVPLSARTVIDLAPDYYFITTGSKYSHSAGGGRRLPSEAEMWSYLYKVKLWYDILFL